MENSMEVPQKKKKKIELPYDPAISLLGYIQRKQNQYLEEISAPHVHCSIIYNRQNTETT